MAAAHSDLIFCSACKNEKSFTEFNVNKSGDGYYPNCKSCFHDSSVRFWADKHLKYCKECQLDKPLRKFTFWKGVPYQRCNKCFETDICNRRAAQRAERAKRSCIDCTSGDGVGEAGGPRAKVSNVQQPPPTSGANVFGKQMEGYFRPPPTAAPGTFKTPKSKP